MTTANDRPALGEYLLALRARAGLSRREAAEGLGITRSYLCRLELTYPGVGAPSHALVHRLARFYEVPADRLFALAGMAPDDLLESFATDPTFLRLVREAIAHWTYGESRSQRIERIS